jgi:hypothetical protein
MLAAMERPTVATLRTIADLHGLPWTDSELEAALPTVTGALAMLATLEAIAVDSVEPTTHFRVV